jgi:hypothetical protein
VDPETQRNRDREVAQLRREGVPFRVIADRLGMSLGAVQKALRRAQKLPAVGGLGPRAGAIDPADADAWRQLNPVERYRFAFVPGGKSVPVPDDDHWLCCCQRGLDPNWRPGGHDRICGHPWPPGGSRRIL